MDQRVVGLVARQAMFLSFSVSLPLSLKALIKCPQVRIKKIEIKSPEGRGGFREHLSRSPQLNRRWLR